MPRIDKIRTLIEREAMRLFKNPSALMLLGLMVSSVLGRRPRLLAAIEADAG